MWTMGLPLLELKGLDMVGEISGSEDPIALKEAGIVREVIDCGYLSIEPSENMRRYGLKTGNVGADSRVMESLLWLIDDGSIVDIEARKDLSNNNE